MNKPEINKAKAILGERLKAIRKAKKISTYNLTTDQGLRFESITSIEKGNRSYTVDSLLIYCKGIGMKLDFMEDSTDIAFNQPEVS